jgi:hypothetical protein
MARTPLAGRDVRNPTRATTHPTTERRLRSWEGLPLTIMRAGCRRRSHLTPLSCVQQRILALLDVPVAISMRLCPDSYKPP